MVDILTYQPLITRLWKMNGSGEVANVAYNSSSHFNVSS